MSFSPQQIEGMLEALAKRGKRPQAPPLGVESSYFLSAEGASPLLPPELPRAEPTSTPGSAVPPQQVDRPPSPSPVAPPSVAPAVSLPQRASGATAKSEGEEGSLGDGFAAFSGKSRQGGFPSGAKNVQCHSIERDPDSGRISKVYTYSLPEESSDGT